MPIQRGLQCLSKGAYDGQRSPAAIGYHYSLLIIHYSFPKVSPGITAPYGGTYLCNIDQQAINFLLLIFNYQTMPQAFQARKFFTPKTDPKQEVYKPVPYYFGTLSTQDAADQIAEESSLTKGDVLNVLDRYQRYVIKNLQKGYKVELLGFGTVYNRFVTEKGVATAPEVKATHIRTIVPGFSPSYTILNGARRYSLLGEKTSLLKVTILGTPVEEGGGSDSESPDEI